MKNLAQHVGASVAKRKLIQRGERILVAVSGGLDSMALLRVLHELATANGWKLAVAHFNHRLRGRASDGDEAFVAQAAKKLGATFISESGDVKAHAKKEGISTEMAARELRHRFFVRAARKLECKCVATAHHADDQAELFFLRLFRGAGGEGLSGMKWSSPSPADAKIRIVRPLLGVSRADLEKFARVNEIRFREDATNASREFLRNRIRHELLPLVRRDFQPGIHQTLARLMEIIRGETEVVEEMASRWLKAKRPVFSKLAVAIQRRIIQQQLRRLKIGEDFELIESLRTTPKMPVTVKPGVRAQRDVDGSVNLVATILEQFATNQVICRVGAGGGRVSFDDISASWRVSRESGKGFAAKLNREQFDAERVGAKVILRHWRPGDRFQPIGLKSEVKLQDWFTNRKIPRAWRTRLAIGTTADGTIFWVEGERIGERFKLRTGTKLRLIWDWKRD